MAFLTLSGIIVALALLAWALTHFTARNLVILIVTISCVGTLNNIAADGQAFRGSVEIGINGVHIEMFVAMALTSAIILLAFDRWPKIAG